MSDISNKTIVSLLMVVMVVTVVGTVFSVNKLEEFVGRFAMVTGAATSGSGYVNLTVGSNVAITVFGNISFGTGYVNESNLTANISSNVSYANVLYLQIGTPLVGPGTGWVNTSGGGWDNGTNITINNTGNTIINVTFNASQNVADWIGGTDPDARIGFVNREGGSCTGNIGDSNKTFSQQINTTVQSACTSPIQGKGLDFIQQNDTIAALVNLLLPRNLKLGQLTNTISFTAASNQ